MCKFCQKIKDGLEGNVVQNDYGFLDDVGGFSDRGALRNMRADMQWQQSLAVEAIMIKNTVN